MAICLRRALRNCNPFSYSSGRCHPFLTDQKNSTSSSITANEINDSCVASGDPVHDNSYQPKISTALNTADKISKNYDLKNELGFIGNELICDKIYLSHMYGKEFIYCAKECRDYKGKETDKENSSSPIIKADLSQLEEIQNKLCKDLPEIFVRTLDHEIYHKDVIFENNIRGTKTIGIRNYMNQIAFLRVYASILFSHVKFEIIKVTCHNDDGTVRLRWRIRGVPGLKVLFLFLKQVSNQRESLEQEEVWFDGFSIFYVKSDGLIHKHIASKLMPDDAGGFLSVKNALAAKLALITGAASHDLAVPMLTDAECMYFLKSLNYSHLNVSKWNCSSLMPFIFVFDKQGLFVVEEKTEDHSSNSHSDL